MSWCYRNARGLGVQVRLSIPRSLPGTGARGAELLPPPWLIDRVKPHLQSGPPWRTIVSPRTLKRTRLLAVGRQPFVDISAEERAVDRCAEICSPGCVMLPAEVSEMRKRLVTLSMQSRRNLENVWAVYAGRDSAVGIAIRYGMDGPGIESQWERDFPHSSRPALSITQSPVQRVLGLFSRRYSGRGVA